MSYRDCPQYRRSVDQARKRTRRSERKSADNYGGKDLLAIKLMRTGAKKRPSYRVVVKEKQSKRDGAYLENLGTYNPTREPAEISLKMDRVRYWIANGAQPTETVRRLIKASGKTESTTEAATA